MHQFYRGAGLVIFSAVGFGFMPILALFAYRGEMNVPTLLFLRFALAALVFLLYLKKLGCKIKISRGRLVPLLILGGVLYPLQAAFYFSAVKYIPVSLAALLLYTYPAFVAVISAAVDREKPAKQIIASIVLSFLGLFFVLGVSFAALNFFGALLALAAAVVYSCYFILGNRLVKDIPPLMVSALICFFAAPALLITGLLAGAVNFHFQPQAWLPVGGLVLFSTVFAILALLRGIALIGSTKAAIFSIFEPLVTVLFSALIFAERLTLPQFLGGAAVLAGAFLIVAAQRQENQEAEKTAVS